MLIICLLGILILNHHYRPIELRKKREYNYLKFSKIFNKKRKIKISFKELFSNLKNLLVFIWKYLIINSLKKEIQRNF